MPDPTPEPTTETMSTSEPKTETETPKTEAPVAPSYSQSDVDKAVSKALNTREKALNEEREVAELRKTQDFAALSKRQDAQIRTLKDQAKRSDYIAEHGLKDYSSVLAHVPVGELDKAVESIKNAQNAAVMTQVSKQLETKAPVTGEPTAPKAFNDLTPDQWAEKKKALGIH